MPAKIDQWLTIKDFRPGIRSRANPSGVDGRATEVPGVASATSTYACQALPDGSLGPMPRNTYTFSFGSNLPIDPTSLNNGRLTISGYLKSGPIVLGTESHVAFEGWKTSDNKRYWYWTRVRHFASDQVDTLKSFAPGTEGAITSFGARPTWFDNFRAHSSDATLPGLPGVVAGWFAGGGGSDRTWHMFPGPSTPTSDTPVAISTGLDVYPSIVHQGRVVAFDQGSYAHGANSYVWTHNEDIYFTNANLTTLAFTTAQTFGAENASGYRAAISANHQELLMVKITGGGLLIRGDLADPTVLRLPGLPPVAVHTPAVCPAGIVMLDWKSGAWLWTGGETAENISRDALGADKFLLPTEDFIDFFGKLAYWYDWVLFPNNWAWNWKEDTWWRLENPSNVRIMQYSVMENVLYGVPAYVSLTTDTVEYGWDYSSPARNYSWNSQPIPIGDNREVTIREVVLVATGVGTVDVIFTNRGGSTETHSFSINSTTVPVHMRDNCAVDCQSIQVRLAVTSSGDNVPIVHQLRMGLQSTTHYPHRTA